MLTPRDEDKLQIFIVAMLAHRRRRRGLKLNHPEAVALITDHVLEGARDGRTVTELASSGRNILSTDDVLPGVESLVHTVQVEATFVDGTKLVTVHNPIRSGSIPAREEADLDQLAEEVHAGMDGGRMHQGHGRGQTAGSGGQTEGRGGADEGTAAQTTVQGGGGSN